MATYPAITIWQPWASLILAGWKPFEFRKWAAPARLVGQRIAVHAGARAVRKAEIADLLLRLRREGGAGTGLRVVPELLEFLERVHTSPTMLPTASVVCTAVLGDPRKATAIFSGGAIDSDRIDQHVWAWPLTEIRPVSPFVPARGQQGWWSWSDGEEA